ncbi:MAG: hypothetical protein MRJ65_03040 [Candidatus Brocadiaceae bacterium]|nr:hypothetical protein [Candidatus Brocadiaceae bacterium]
MNEERIPWETTRTRAHSILIFQVIVSILVVKIFFVISGKADNQKFSDFNVRRRETGSHVAPADDTLKEELAELRSTMDTLGPQKPGSLKYR